MSAAWSKGVSGHQYTITERQPCEYGSMSNFEPLTVLLLNGVVEKA